MKSLVIGYGSIGRRHARVLAGMGHEVGFVTRAASIEAPYARYGDPAVALAQFVPDYVVIANDTGLHGATLSTLADLGYRGITLVEKPLLADPQEAVRLPSGPVFVGYTLRFHPVFERLQAILQSQPLWTLSAYVGQYLPDWRPDSDYRQSYSARAADGGVVRDLSHELDYLQVLAGNWQRTTAAGGHLSPLVIESEDAVSILSQHAHCPLVSVHLNYLDRSTSRWILANGPFGTVRADLVNGVLSVNGKEEQLPLERDMMLRAQHAAALRGQDARLCTISAAMRTLQWIDAIHLAIAEPRWIDAPLEGSPP